MESLFNQVTGLQVFNFIKERFQHRCFFVKISKVLKTAILKKICVLLLFSNVKPNFSSINLRLQNRCSYKCFPTFAGKHLYRNVVYNKCIHRPSLFKNRLRSWCFPDSSLKILTKAFLTKLLD